MNKEQNEKCGCTRRESGHRSGKESEKMGLEKQWQLGDWQTRLQATRQCNYANGLTDFEYYYTVGFATSAVDEGSNPDLIVLNSSRQEAVKHIRTLVAKAMDECSDMHKNGFDPSCPVPAAVAVQPVQPTKLIQPIQVETGFAVMATVSPDKHHYVCPRGLDGLVSRLREPGDMKNLVVCDISQTGKSTLRDALARELRSTNTHVYLVAFGSGTANSVSGFWWQMMDSLSRQHPDRFQKPPGHDQQQTYNFEYFVTWFQQKAVEGDVEYLLCDNTSVLSGRKQKVFNNFMDGVAWFRTHHKEHTLKGIALFGLPSIRTLLNRHNRQKSSSKGGSKKPTFQDDEFCQVHRLEVEDLVALIKQHVQHQNSKQTAEHQRRIFQNQDDILKVARHIKQITEGHAGLAGVCLRQLEQHSIKNVLEWRKFNANFLGDVLRTSATFVKVYPEARR